MKFGHQFQETSSKLVPHLVSHLPGGLDHGPARAAFVLYKDLKKQLKSTTLEHGREVERRKGTALDIHDECAVCLEPFNTLSAGFKTACGHTFHPVCFVDAVTEGPCRCPLCRRPLQETLPTGVDSYTLGFAAKMRIQAEEISDCYQRMLRDLRAQARDLGAAVHSSRFTNVRAVLSGQRRGMLEQQLARAGELVDRVVSLVEYVRINLMAFRKICKKIDKQLGSSMGQQVPARLMKRPFYLDCAENGNGSLLELYESLVTMGHETAAKLNHDRANVHLPAFGGIFRRSPREDVVFLPEPFEFVASAILYTEASPVQERAEEGAGQPASFDEIENHLQAISEALGTPHDSAEGGRAPVEIGIAPPPVRCHCPVM